MVFDEVDDCPGRDPPAADVQLSFLWDITTVERPHVIEPGPNQYSLAPNDESHGGGFNYEERPKIFLGRRGYGPLRIAWDTNILIDYAKYGEHMWEDDQFEPPVEESRYLEVLIALNELMHLWMLRDIRIKMPFRQIDDARRRLDPEVWLLRAWQLEQFHVALSCVDLDKALAEGVRPFETLPEGSSNDDWDQSLVDEAIATGCHVFLTNDRRLKRRADRRARESFLAIVPSSELLDLLAEAGQLSLAAIGRYPLPDSHKWTHVMDAHSGGYPGNSPA